MYRDSRSAACRANSSHRSKHPYQKAKAFQAIPSSIVTQSQGLTPHMHTSKLERIHLSWIINSHHHSPFYFEAPRICPCSDASVGQSRRRRRRRMAMAVMRRRRMAMAVMRRRGDTVVASAGDHLRNGADGLAADPLAAARREAHPRAGVLEAAVAFQAHELRHLRIRVRRVRRANRRRRRPQQALRDGHGLPQHDELRRRLGRRTTGAGSQRICYRTCPSVTLTITTTSVMTTTCNRYVIRVYVRVHIPSPWAWK
jgi:hypothetical protein